VGSGDSVDWQLPPQPGAHVAYVLVSDGRGGDVQGQISLNVGAQGDAFTGRAVDQVGRPVARAEVAINGLRAVTDPNGFFRVVVEPADRYVLNINASGFAPLSRLFDRPSNGHTWKLVPAQVSQVNPANPIHLVDRRPILEQRDQKGAHVQVPAGSLVDASGNQPPGNLRATLATLALRRDAAPGDWIAKDGASDAGLISYGLVVVEFTDSAGKIYNLAPGRTAEVTIPVPASMLAHAPPRMPIWTYDPRDGYSKVKLEVLDANGNLLPDAIVEDGDTRGTLGTPADPNLWPPFPYTNCKPVTLKLDALWAGYPSSPFLTFKQSGADLTSAQAYYAGVDPPDTAAGFPNGRRTTLADWWSVNGFDASGEASAGPDYARTSYLNNNDLGSGHDMHFVRHTVGLRDQLLASGRDGKPRAVRSEPGFRRRCRRQTPARGDGMYGVFTRRGRRVRNQDRQVLRLFEQCAPDRGGPRRVRP
jgi:hypothetical protein